MTQRVITLNVKRFDAKDIATKLNDALSNKNLAIDGIFFDAQSWLKGNITIIVEPQKEIPVLTPVEIIKEIEVIKEVPLKIVNQIKKQRGASSQYRGVCKKGSKWYAMIQVDGKKHWCGSYFHETDAAEAYDRKAYELLGERSMAILNFPQNFEKVAK